MARMPFARYLARIVGETPAPYVTEAMDWLWGEWAIRQTVQARKTKKVRDYYLFVRRAFERCDDAQGRRILIDEGELSTCGTYGHGHVYVGGNVKKADVVIVEDERGKRTLAFEVKLVRGSIRRNGRFTERIRDTYIVVSLPRGDRGTGKEQRDGRIDDSRGGIRDRNPWDTSARGVASSFSGPASGHGRTASK